MDIVIFVDFEFLMYVYISTTQFSNGILLCQGSFIQCQTVPERQLELNMAINSCFFSQSWKREKKTKKKEK